MVRVVVCVEVCDLLRRRRGRDIMRAAIRAFPHAQSIGPRESRRPRRRNAEGTNALDQVRHVPRRNARIKLWKLWGQKFCRAFGHAGCSAWNCNKRAAHRNLRRMQRFVRPRAAKVPISMLFQILPSLICLLLLKRIYGIQTSERWNQSYLLEMGVKANIKTRKDFDRRQSEFFN